MKKDNYQMGDQKAEQIYQGVIDFKEVDVNGGGHENCLVMEDGGDSDMYVSRESSLEEDSINSVSSSSSSDLVEDASSSSSSSLNSNGPLFELSELMANLPIKGLSKFYQGKAQSFTSLARVKSIEDFPKKVVPYRKKLKSCKSYGGLDVYKSAYNPKATISKNKASSRGSNFVYLLGNKRGSLIM